MEVAENFDPILLSSLSWGQKGTPQVLGKYCSRHTIICGALGQGPRT